MNDCCANLENRAPGCGPRGDAGIPKQGSLVSTHPELFGGNAAKVNVTHCTVCTARHVELEVPPIKLGLKGKEITA